MIPKGIPVREPLGSMWHDPQQLKHVHPEALGSPSGYVVPTGHRLLRPHAHSESLPAAYDFAAGAAAPKENGLRWESRGSPIYSAGLCSRAASHTPATRRVRLTVSSSSVLAFTPVSRVRHTLEVSRLQSSLIPKSTGIVTARELASPNTARQVISTVSAKVFFKGGRPRCSGRFLANLDILRLTTRGLTRLRRGSRRSWAISSSSN